MNFKEGTETQTLLFSKGHARGLTKSVFQGRTWGWPQVATLDGASPQPCDVGSAPLLQTRKPGAGAVSVRLTSYSQRGFPDSEPMMGLYKES